MELPILIFLVVLTGEILSSIGKDTISEFVSFHFLSFHLKYGTNIISIWRTQFHSLTQLFSNSPQSKQERELKTKILKGRTELASTSSQDEFAKWAKLRRRLDKDIADFETLSKSFFFSFFCLLYILTIHSRVFVESKSSITKQSFISKFKKLLWLIMTVLPFIFSSYHRKSAVFYLPPGWFEPLTWYMGLPKAPAGSF